MARPNWLNIPRELKEQAKWAVSTLTRLPNGKEDKSPRDPRTGMPLSTTDLKGWSDFYTAANAGYPAIGMLLQRDGGLVAIDLDSKTDEDEFRGSWQTIDGPASTEDLAKLQNEIYGSVQSYTEFSNSGQGAHIIVRAKLDGGVRRKGVEVYGRDRYMITTGQILRDMSITPQQAMIDDLVQFLGGIEHEVNGIPPSVHSDETPESFVDRARSARNGDKFWGLYNYRPQAGDDWSSLDASLAQMIVFFTDDHELAMEVFRRSGLYRGHGEKRGYEGLEKYETQYLRNRTFARAWRLKAKDREFAEKHIAEGRILAEQLIASYKAKQVIKSEAPKSVQIPWPTGLLGEIASYIYTTAQRPVAEVALGGAIVFFAGLVGRQYNVSDSGLNQYVLVIAKTGRGKEAASAGIDRLVASVEARNPAILEFVGPGHIASGQGLVRAVASHPSMFSVQAEFGHTLKLLADPRASSADLRTRQALLDLFSKSGKGRKIQSSAYSDTDRNTQVVDSPSFSMFGESTPDKFDKAVGVDLVNEGFLPRFVILRYDGDRVAKNPRAGDAPPTTLIEAVGQIVDTVTQLHHSNNFVTIPIEAAAQILLDKFDKQCDNSINDPQAGDSIEIWNRAHLKATRLAALAAVGDDWHEPVVRDHNARWAIELITRDIDATSRKLESGDVGEGEITYEHFIIKVCRAYLLMSPESRASYKVSSEFLNGTAIPFTYLRRCLRRIASIQSDKRGITVAIKTAIDDAVEAQILEEVTSKNRRTCRVFVIGTQFPKDVE